MTITRREFIKNAIVTAFAFTAGLFIAATRAPERSAGEPERPAPVDDLVLPVEKKPTTSSFADAFADSDGTTMVWITGFPDKLTEKWRDAYARAVMETGPVVYPPEWDKYLECQRYNCLPSELDRVAREE